MPRRKASTPGPYLLEAKLLRERITDPQRYPYCLPAIRSIDALPFHPKVTFFVGENGSGKSTLLEAIAMECDLNPEGGSRNFNFATRASHSSLHEALRLSKAPKLAADSYFLRAESFYNVATEIERLGANLLQAYGGKSLHEQSHGESFFALFEHRFRGCGLYLMDEPEAALSPRRQLQFLAVLHDHCRRGSQFVIATHSPIIMAYPDAWIYVLDEKGIRRVPYTETEHYLVTRGFLTSPRNSLAVLLADDDTETADPGHQQRRNTPMSKWREMFEAELPPVAERPYRTEYDFGPPAAADQIAAAEAALKVQFPADVREMLAEFNGMWRRTHFDDGREYRDIFYLDIQNMTVDLPQYFADCGNPLPPKKDRRKVVFICQANGFAELWGVCVEEVGGHPAGSVVKLDSEVGEFEPSHASLAEFVRGGPR